MKEPVYLDYNATTPVDPRVFDRMVPYLKNKFGNPSSGHPIGWDARGAVEDAREQVASLLGCSAGEILFTSGGTESNNLAILGTAFTKNTPGQIVTTIIEHPATLEPLAHLERQGWTIDRVGVDKECLVKLDALMDRITPNTFLVTVMHSNNETGALQPISQIGTKARAHGVLVHTDAAQSIGKVKVNVKDLMVDLLSVAGHKLYAPKGTGALYIREGTAISPILRGAGQERGLKPGTENVAGIVALGAACEIAAESLTEDSERLKKLRDTLFELLAESVPNLKLSGPIHGRLPNTLNVRFPGVPGTRILAICDGIAASTGAACHEGGEETPSAVLTAMGIDDQDALGAIRLSIGRAITASQIERAAAEIVSAYRKLQKASK